jgi:hypothetical protein
MFSWFQRIKALRFLIFKVLTYLGFGILRFLEPLAVAPVAYYDSVAWSEHVTDVSPAAWFRAAYGSAGAHSSASSGLASSASTWDRRLQGLKESKFKGFQRH